MHPLEEWRHYVDPDFLDRVPAPLPLSLLEHEEAGFPGYRLFTGFGVPNFSSTIRQCFLSYERYELPNAAFGHIESRLQRMLRAVKEATEALQRSSHLPEVFGQAACIAAVLHRMQLGDPSDAHPLLASAHAAEKFLHGRGINPNQRLVVYYAILCLDQRFTPSGLLGLLMKTAEISPSSAYDFGSMVREFIGRWLFDDQDPPASRQEILQRLDTHVQWVVPRQFDVLDKRVAPGFTDRLGWRHALSLTQTTLLNLQRGCAPHEHAVLESLLQQASTL